MCEEKGKLGRSCMPLLLKVLSDNDLERGNFPFNLALATHYFYRLIFSCFRQTTSTDRVMTIICTPICWKQYAFFCLYLKSHAVSHLFSRVPSFLCEGEYKKEGEGPTNIGVIRSHVLSAKTSDNNQ